MMYRTMAVPDPTHQTITVKLRLRDKHASELCRQARAVNFVWNFCNETQKKAAQANRRWLEWTDLQGLTAGSSKLLDIHGHTIQRVCQTYDDVRKTNKKAWLRWRSRKSLGWVPTPKDRVLFDGEAFVFRRMRYELMHQSAHLTKGMRFGAGSFNADAKGHWYINVPVDVKCAGMKPERAVGIDLGLKTLATLSTGDKIEMPRFYRENEQALATAQRARKTRRARAIHAKALNRRKDFLHKASAALCAEYGTIIVGDVSPSKLAKTMMAKSVHDAGWAGFKGMLRYKAITRGRRYLEVSEAYTTQVCFSCLARSGPKGLKDLGIRRWQCCECGVNHDRDHNAALSIVRLGLESLAEGAPPRSMARKPRLRREGSSHRAERVLDTIALAHAPDQPAGREALAQEEGE